MIWPWLASSTTPGHSKKNQCLPPRYGATEWSRKVSACLTRLRILRCRLVHFPWSHIEKFTTQSQYSRHANTQANWPTRHTRRSAHMFPIPPLGPCPVDARLDLHKARKGPYVASENSRQTASGCPFSSRAVLSWPEQLLQIDRGSPSFSGGGPSSRGKFFPFRRL